MQLWQGIYTNCLGTATSSEKNPIPRIYLESIEIHKPFVLQPKKERAFEYEVREYWKKSRKNKDNKAEKCEVVPVPFLTPVLLFF